MRIGGELILQLVQITIACAYNALLVGELLLLVDYILQLLGYAVEPFLLAVGNLLQFRLGFLQILYPSLDCSLMLLSGDASLKLQRCVRMDEHTTLSRCNGVFGEHVGGVIALQHYAGGVAHHLRHRTDHSFLAVDARINGNMADAGGTGLHSASLTYTLQIDLFRTDGDN